MSVKKSAFPLTQVVPIAHIYKFETHYTSIKCTPMPGRKDGLHDRVEGGLNTSVLMTPRWDHLFPDKRAQGWEKKENIRRPGDIGRVVRGGSWWWNACVCVYVCTWTDECVLSVSVYCVNVDHYSCFATLRILAWIRHKRQKASYLCLRVKDYLFHWMCPPIICLSLPALFNLFLVSAQWLPLTVSPSQM